MAEINLHTGVNNRKLNWSKFASIFRSAGVVLILLFFVTAAILILVIVLNQGAIDQARGSEDEYKNRLKTLSQVEVQYSFLKDRAKKATDILQSRKVVKNLKDLNSVLTTFGDIKLKSVELTGNRLSISAVSSSYSSLKGFLAEVQSFGSYKTRVINSLNYSPSTGYSVEVKLE